MSAIAEALAPEGIDPDDLPARRACLLPTESAGFTRSKVCFSDNWFSAARPSQDGGSVFLLRRWQRNSRRGRVFLAADHHAPTGRLVRATPQPRCAQATITPAPQVTAAGGCEGW